MQKALAFFKKNRFHFLAFFIPTAAVLIGYAAMGIFPFGNNSILTMDLWGQYFPMIKNVSDQLFSGEGLFSFDGALGFNNIAQSAYYTNSPSWVLLALLPGSAAIYVINYIVLLKFGLASLSFSILLRHKFRKNNFLTCAISSAYALSTYAIAYISQTMWQDAVVLLPLVVLGLEIMLKTRRPYLYFASLFLTVWSNFYVGYIVCLFTLLYYLIRQASCARSLRRFFRQSCDFGIVSLLAGGSAAAVLVPTYKAIQLTLASSMGWGGELKAYHTLHEVLGSTVFGEGVSLEYGVPNIYCSVIVFVSLLLFAFNRRLSLRKRIIYTATAAFLILSMNLNILDYIWHGFHYPNQLPGRFSFVYCFLILFITAYALLSLRSMKLPYLIASGVIPLAAVVYLAVSDDIEAWRVAVTLVCIAIYVASVFIYVYSNHKKLAMNIVAGVLTVEVCANAVFLLASDTRHSSINSYISSDSAMQELTEKYSPEKGEFWRMEILPHFTFNPGMMYGYSGVSYYSSTMTGAGYDFFRSLGCAVYAQNVSTVYRQTPVLNSIFSLRYIFDRDGKNSSFGMKLADVIGGSPLYENEYCLPIAFMADPAVLELELEAKGYHLENQNKLFSALSGRGDVFHKIDFDRIEIDNASIVIYDGREYYSRKDDSRSADFVYKFTATSGGYYLYENLFKYGVISVTVNNQRLYSENFGYQDIKSLGYLNAGDTVTIAVCGNNNFALYGIDLYSFDPSEFALGYATLSNGGMEISKMTSTRIKGNVNASTDGILFTSIPQDGGWTVKVDGKAREVKTVCDYLCAVELGAGEHTVEFSYSPPGFRAGIGISAVCILGFGLYASYIERIRRKNKLAGHAKQ